MAVGAAGGRRAIGALVLLGLGTGVGAAIAACQSLPSIVLTADGGTFSSHGGSAGNGIALGGGGAGGSEPHGGGGTSATPVYLGITPTPIHAGPGEPTAAETLAAALTVRAIGVRATVLSVPWQTFDSAAAARLATDVAHARAAGLRIAVDLMVVDRAANLRPLALANAPWDEPDVEAALVLSLDAIVPLAPDWLILGRDVNRYLAIHSSEAPALHALFTNALAHVALAPTPPVTGVSLGYAGEDPADATFGLQGLGDVSVFSYLPDVGATALAPETTPAKALDVMLALAGGRPMLIERAAFPTSAALGASEVQQEQFFAALFAALGPRRARIPLVNLHELADPPPDRCAAYLVVQGEPAGSPLGAWLCTDGVRAADGTPRAAWSEIVAAVAHFASP